MPARRRAFAVLILCAACALAASAPSSARTDRSEAGGALAASILGDLAKTGVKAGIGYLAPDMVKYTDPTAYGLSQIQAQLDQIQNSLVNLSQSVNRLDLRLACDQQRTRLEPIVAGVITAERALKDATLAPTEVGKKERLEAEVLPLIQKLEGNGDQLILHRALTGQAGESLITACGKWLEEQNGPVLTQQFSERVDALYDTYAMTAATLMMLRVNYWHYYPHRYAEDEIQRKVAEVQHFRITEHALLKTPVPWWGFVDLRTGWIWEKRTLQVSHLIASTLHHQGYKLSGWDQSPTCEDIVALIHGFPGSVSSTLGLFGKVRCHNGYDGVIDLGTKQGGNNGLSFTQLGQLQGMAAKPWDVKQYSYR